MYFYTEREINALKTELYMAKAELKYMERRLAKAKAELSVTEAVLENTTMWLRTYKSSYEYNLQKCETLAKANEELKLSNKCLETSLKAFKSIINALKRKEMI